MADYLIIGGTSSIAAELIAALRPDHSLMVLTGREWTPPKGVEHALVELTTYDGSHTRHWQRDYDGVLCIAPIKHMPRFLDFVPNVAKTRCVFLSSNNAALLSGNADYAALRDAEAAVLDRAPDSLILQPTAICGRPGDPVLGHIHARIADGETVWLAGAKTRQWPVDFRDVARAMQHALSPDITSGRYSLSGPQGASYTELVTMIETAAWRPARHRDLPAGLTRLAGHAVPDGAALRRVGIDRRPVNPPLPGFEPHYSLSDMLLSLTEGQSLPS